MFRHILIPTDGSRLAARGVRAGMRFAKALGAKVSGLYVVFPYVPPIYGEAALYYVPGLTPKESRKAYEKQAKKALDALRAEAARARVRCTTRYVTSGQPWQAILREARARRCDAIVMASHGRGGLGGLLLGSETTHVLGNSKIPVLVVR